MNRVTIANLPDINEIEDLNSVDLNAVYGGTTIIVDAPGNKLIYDTNPIALINFVLGIPGRLNRP
jgi:dihydroorotase-like cyclic amidohydrolase